MRPWSLHPLTVGMAESVVRNPGAIIQWRWWCRGFLRRLSWQEAAFEEVIIILSKNFNIPESKDKKEELVRKGEIVSESVPKVCNQIREFSCRVALALGGDSR